MELRIGPAPGRAASFRRILDLFNSELVAFCEERGVACYDLASDVPPTEENFYDFCHFTEAGARRVAELVSAQAAKLLKSARD